MKLPKNLIIAFVLVLAYLPGLYVLTGGLVVEISLSKILILIGILLAIFFFAFKSLVTHESVFGAVIVILVNIILMLMFYSLYFAPSLF